MRIKFLLSVFLLICGINISAQEDNNYPFQSGEKLSYVLNYTWGGVVTDVGSAQCVTTYNDGIYDVLLTGKTYRFFDVFFKVRERFETKFYEKNLRPIQFYRSASEGKYTMKNTLVFNHSNNTIKSRTQRKQRAPQDTLLQGSENTFDLISLFFNYRCLDPNSFEVGKRIPMEFVIDKKIYTLFLTYIGREKKRVSGVGTFNSLKFAATVVQGNVFSGKDNLYLWVTDDQNKIPIFFESPILVGKVQGRISKIEGNKYPLSSKVK